MQDRTGRQEPRFARVLHGGDYNPEQWPEELWDEDIRLMREAHWNVATLPVFGWVALQPAEDQFSFEWLDRIIAKLHAAGIAVCLATATASTPAWLDQRYPDVLRVDRDGRRLRHGQRHTFCPSSPNFRRLAAGLAARLAERYGRHPAVVAWHISNEYGNHCYCDQCAAAFRAWLQARYGSLAELNRRWYAAFWGHTYTDWSQVEPPTTTGQRSLQGLLLDYDRFQSASLLACFEAEAAAIRPHSPHLPITTNLMGAFKPLDYHSWARSMDIVSWDCYPRKGARPAEIAFAHTLMRGLREGQPFMLMEQTPSQQNWQPQNALKRPGVLRLWSYQAMAHGADTVMYFQWRRGRGAQEKFHGAVVEHVGHADTRVFREVAALGAELERLGARTLGGRVPARVALLFDWPSWWALEYSSGPSVDLRYVPQCQAYFAALHALGIPADIVSPDADLAPYDLVIAPVLYMVRDGLAERLRAVVERGGTLLTTFMSGIVDANDLVHLGGYPGPLRALLGIWVEEVDALTPDEGNAVVFERPFAELQGAYPCGLICERVHLEGAAALATFGEDFYAGEPALTMHRAGAGRAYYLATSAGPELLTPLLKALCAELGVAPALPELPAGVEALPRVSPDGTTVLYVLNHTAQAVALPLPPGVHRDLLTDQPRSGALELSGYGVALLVPEPAGP